MPSDQEVSSNGDEPNTKYYRHDNNADAKPYKSIGVGNEKGQNADSVANSCDYPEICHKYTYHQFLWLLSFLFFSALVVLLEIALIYALQNYGHCNYITWLIQLGLIICVAILFEVIVSPYTGVAGLSLLFNIILSALAYGIA